MQNFNFKETYLIEGFFDDLDNTDSVIDTISNLSLNYMDINCSNYEFIIKYEKYNEMFDVYENKYDNRKKKLTHINLSYLSNPDIKTFYFSEYNDDYNLESAILHLPYINNISSFNLMFDDCKALDTIELSVNSINVTKMFGMFRRCINLKTVNIHDINTSNVNDMRDMFYKCESLKELDLSKFHVSKNVRWGGMFQYCRSLETLNLGKNFNPDYCDDAFKECDSLKTIICTKNFRDMMEYDALLPLDVKFIIV